MPPEGCKMGGSVGDGEKINWKPIRGQNEFIREFKMVTGDMMGLSCFSP